MSEALAAIEGFCRLEIQRRLRPLSAEQVADHQRLAGWLRSLIDGATAGASADLKHSARVPGREPTGFNSTHLMESLGIKPDAVDGSGDLIGDAARATFASPAAEPAQGRGGYDSNHLLGQLGIQVDAPSEADRGSGAPRAGSTGPARQPGAQVGGGERSGSHDLSDRESADLLRQAGLQVEEEPRGDGAHKRRRAPPTPTRPMSASLADMLKPQSVPPSGYTPRRDRAYLSDYYSADVVPLAGASSAQVLRAVDGGGNRIQLSEEMAALYGLGPDGGSEALPSPPPQSASAAASGATANITTSVTLPPRSASASGATANITTSVTPPPRFASAPPGPIPGPPATSSGLAASLTPPPRSAATPPGPIPGPPATSSGLAASLTPPPRSVATPPTPAPPRPDASGSGAPPSGGASARGPAAPQGFEATTPAGSPSVVHLLAGGSLRGMVRRFDPDEGLVELHPRGGAAPERLPMGDVLAIFFGPGSYPEPETGRRLTVRLTNGREVSGLSPDYTDQAAAFSLRPADARGNVVRIWVTRAAVDGLQLHDA